MMSASRRAIGIAETVPQSSIAGVAPKNTGVAFADEVDGFPGIQYDDGFYHPGRLASQPTATKDTAGNQEAWRPQATDQPQHTDSQDGLYHPNQYQEDWKGDVPSPTSGGQPKDNAAWKPAPVADTLPFSHDDRDGQQDSQPRPTGLVTTTKIPTIESPTSTLTSPTVDPSTVPPHPVLSTDGRKLQAEFAILAVVFTAALLAALTTWWVRRVKQRALLSQGSSEGNEAGAPHDPETQSRAEKIKTIAADIGHQCGTGLTSLAESLRAPISVKSAISAAVPSPAPDGRVDAIKNKMRDWKHRRIFSLSTITSASYSSRSTKEAADNRMSRLKVQYYAEKPDQRKVGCFTPAVVSIYQVEMDFEPTSSGHLTLKKGQCAGIYQIYNDGWAACTIVDTGEEGLAPRACFSTWPVGEGQCCRSELADFQNSNHSSSLSVVTHIPNTRFYSGSSASTSGESFARQLV